MNSLLKITVFIFSSLFFLVILFNLLQMPLVKDTVALATTVKPETFTELYFENHTTLPKTTEAATAQTFSFTIHNLEYKTLTYPYEVYIEDFDGNRAEILKDIVKLSHDEKKTIPVYYQLNVPVRRAKVVVKLTAKKQEIHYWIGEELSKVLASPSATISPNEE